MTRRIINFARILHFSVTMTLSLVETSQFSVNIHADTIVNPVTIYTDHSGS